MGSLDTLQGVGEAVLQVSNLQRKFKDREVVSDVSFQVLPGQIVGLVGPNGAGKTTTVRMCSTLLQPSGGQIRVCGVDAVADPRRARKHIGLVLGGERGFYMRCSARDNLLLFAQVYGVERKRRKARVEQVLAATKLLDRADDPVDQFSRGMRQRLHIARGLLHEPELLLFDEPTNGLDPDIATDIRAVMRDLARAGHGIVLTTHLLGEMEELADEIYVIQQGKLQTSGNVQEIARSAGIAQVTDISVDGQVPQDVAEELAARAGAVALGLSHFETRTVVSLSWAGQPDEAAIQTWIAERGLQCLNIGHHDPSLEESYIALVRPFQGKGQE